MLLTSGITSVMNFNPFSGPMISLPLQVFDFVKSPEPNMVARGFGTAAVLLLLVLGLFTIARLIGGRGPGQLSDTQRRRVVAASAADLSRMAESVHPPRVVHASLISAPAPSPTPAPTPEETAP